jgi:hypothetical protein
MQSVAEVSWEGAKRAIPCVAVPIVAPVWPPLIALALALAGCGDAYTAPPCEAPTVARVAVELEPGETCRRITAAWPYLLRAIEGEPALPYQCEGVTAAELHAGGPNTGVEFVFEPHLVTEEPRPDGEAYAFEACR